MNILHISNTDLAGGRFTGFYMQSFLGDSHNVKMAVWNKTTNGTHVCQLPPNNPVLRFLSELLMISGDRLGMDGITGFSGWVLPHYDYFENADVVHLHLIHNHMNFSLLSLPMISSKKPIIWTVHDPWAITGGCEHSFDCNRWLSGCAPRCPHPRRRSILKHYLPYFHWKIKRRIYNQSRLTLVVASKWLENKIAISPLLGRFPCHRIPFGIDLNIFKPRSKIETRNKLGIDLGHKVIAFRDVGLLTDKFKGMRSLMKALMIYKPKVPTSLLILQDGKGFNSLAYKYNIVTPGWIDGEDLADALSAADVFLMPSLQEAFGLMAVEAMACGIPVIVFDGTALPDVIQAPTGGLAVPANDILALAEVIKVLIEDDDQRIKLGKQARQLALKEYSFTRYTEQHIDLYDQVLQQYQLHKYN
jgi:glycosyltransferase involved in cell wall biosynthesis